MSSARRRQRSGAFPAALPMIDAWRLTHRAGSGSTAVVYLAQPIEQSVDTESDYALKVLRDELADDRQAQHRLRREVAVARAVSHPNLVPILAANLQDAPYYLLMPRFRGTTLDRVLAKVKRIDVPRALWVARQIAEALGALHAAGWMHLDVKPANVAMDPSGHCTLFDLDLSLPTPRAGAAAETSTGCLHGTLKYTAPELFTSARSAVNASDVYSLGVLLYQMLAGRLPFACSAPHQLVEAHREQLPPSLRTFVPALPVRVSRLVTRMLSKEPNRRPATDGELQDELSRLEIETFALRGIEMDATQRVSAPVARNPPVALFAQLRHS
jgi:serine/threonine-protein kinase